MKGGETMSKQERIQPIKINALKNQKGQSLIETAILSLVLIAITKLILIIFWIFISILWMEHQLYQGILCSASQKNKMICKQDVLQKIKKLSPLGKIQFLQIKKIQNKYKGEMLWIFYNQKFSIKQSLILPQ